jgi:hypothetical protein
MVMLIKLLITEPQSYFKTCYWKKYHFFYIMYININITWLNSYSRKYIYKQALATLTEDAFIYVFGYQKTSAPKGVDI